ncbi:MAG TPA: efflux RND transporter permease subunit [Candidatus Binataceae bacterium]
MPHKSDAELIATTHNTARFFTENRHIAWVALIAVLAWGFYGYTHMPKRKDPDIPIREAQALCPWPGVSAEKVEQLVTRRIEQKVAESAYLNVPGGGSTYGIRSTTLDGLAIVNVQLQEGLSDTKKIFSDIELKLNGINDLPKGAGPIQFYSDFGDTAALMLTVASPRESEVAVSIRAREIRDAIVQARAKLPSSAAASRYTLVYAFPRSINAASVKRIAGDVAAGLEASAAVSDVVALQGAGFVAFDANAPSAKALSGAAAAFVLARFGTALWDPDLWAPIVVHDPSETEGALLATAGDKYTYRELDDFTALLERGMSSAAQVAKVTRRGVYAEEIALDYSQSRLAAYGVTPDTIAQALAARNVAMEGGTLEVGHAQLVVHPSGDFHTPEEIGDVMIARSASGSPVYLRDLVDITRTYASPPTLLNSYTWHDPQGHWQTDRAITLAVEMRSGEQIAAFGKSVDRELALLRQQIPEDLIIARTSDQPRQVQESTDLFMHALYEAIVLVVLVSILGFWEWRSAVVIGLGIPLTLAMTFGMIQVLGLDLQQVSIASLIIALGLLVDDPVVAGDAIKRDLDIGHPPLVAAWMGPTKLARAILFATITNIVAYLPFLMVGGDTGKFLVTLPIVMTAALVASRIVSMTFVPLLGYYLLRPAKVLTLPMEQRRHQGFSGRYFRLGEWCIEHRWKSFFASLVILAGGFYFGLQLKSAFFPNDVQYLSYVDIWLPNDAALSATRLTAAQVRQIIEATTRDFAAHHPGGHGAGSELLKSMTTFVGGGGPRFWVSVSPEPLQPNYAQVVIEIADKDLMPELVPVLQAALSAQVPGAYVDARQLQTNPVKFPIEVHLAGRADVSPLLQRRDIDTLRSLSARVEAIFRTMPVTQSVRDDWQGQVLVANIQVQPDRANLANVTNQDVAQSTAMGLSGRLVAGLREGDRQIPVLMRLRRDERSTVADLENLYVYSSNGVQKVPLKAISTVSYDMENERIIRRDKFRTITVLALPVAGVLASEQLNAAMPQLRAFEKTLPPGYTMTLGGEYEKSVRGNRDLTIVLAISCAMIFVALVIQFNNAVKPWLVFAAVPYGVVGALAALLIMGSPFGFMAFLGVCSLVGVIVSHVIVLFDFIEEMHEKGEAFIESVLDAGIERLRPVMITVGAAVLALIPLAMNGGPLWQPMCYAQIGGLSVATLIELLLVPVLYAIFVLDLKWVTWEPMGHGGPGGEDAARLKVISASAAD